MPDHHHVLVIEDDEGIRTGLVDALTSEGYRASVAGDGATGLAMGLREDPDLIVLDLMMPGMNGFEVLRRLREDQVDTPVLILTARGLEADRVRGLDLGADDYMVKPFGLDEFLARVRSRLRAWDRERGRTDDSQLRFGDVFIDFQAHAATRGDAPITLTPLELKFLRFMARREGRAVTRDALLRHVWESDDVVSRVIDTAVLGLRKKIERDPGKPAHLLSVRGVGYRFVRRAGPADSADGTLTPS